MSASIQSVYGAFVDTAQRYGQRPFLYLVSDTAVRYGCDAGATSYAQALAEVQRLLACYRALALSPGERVALALDNRPEAFYHWLALNALGASVVPLNPQWRAGELEYVFEHSEVHHAICLPDRIAGLAAVNQTLGAGITITSTDELSAHVDAARSPLAEVGDAHSECALLYTSGTTGRPKGCMLSNEYFLASGAWYRDIGGLCALEPGRERLITPLPMYHMNALATSTMAMLMTGGCVVPLDRFHPSSFWHSVEQSQPTVLHYLGVMPVMLMGLEPGPQERQHRIRFGFGAGLSGELHTQFEARFGFKLIEAWAMTETGCSVAVIASEEPRKVGTACFGRPPAHLDYRLVDEQGNDVAAGTPGELLVRRRGNNPRHGFFSGYLKDAAATEAAWASGYFHTGDVVVQDDDGCMHFVDRKKNVIRRSGENIAAVEVEDALLGHPAVKAVAVTAVPDAVRGDEVFACIVTDVPDAQWPATARDIVSYCLGRLAYYKAPGYVGRCAELPLTSTQKVQRGELKALAAAMVAKGQCLDTREMKSKSLRSA